MSTVRTNNILDVSGGNTATINSMTPTADSLQGFRNRIINGAMVIDQRNAGAAVTSDGAYPVDRINIAFATDGAYSAQQSTIAPTGFINSVKWTTTTADSSLTTTQRALVMHNIEGNNVADLGFGTASAKTVTLSFWVRSSLTGTFGGSFANSAQNRSYPFTYTINAADTWEQKTVTVAGDTTGTWVTNNGLGLRIRFSMGVGPTYAGTAGAWAAADYRGATGETNVMGTLNATWYITGVQLEVGSVATPFERRDYGRELAMCQRYYYSQAFKVGNYGTTSSGSRTTVYNKVSMRTTPTYALSGETKSNVGTTFVDVSTTENATAYYLASSNDMVIYTATMTGTAEL